MHVIENDQQIDSLSNILLDSTISWMRFPLQHCNWSEKQRIAQHSACLVVEHLQIVSLLIRDRWISSRMSVIHTCHHGHCCHLKHPSLLHDIKVSTTRTSYLSLIQCIHCSSFRMANGVNQGHVQKCSLLQAIHLLLLYGETKCTWLEVTMYTLISTLLNVNHFTFTLMTSYFQWSSITLQCQLILHVDMDWFSSLVSQRISTIMTLSLDLNWFMIYVYLMYKYWMSIKTPGLHSLIKHSSAVLFNDSGFDVITDHRICFKVNHVVIIGEFWVTSVDSME